MNFIFSLNVGQFEFSLVPTFSPGKKNTRESLVYFNHILQWRIHKLGKGASQGMNG